MRSSASTNRHGSSWRVAARASASTSSSSQSGSEVDVDRGLASLPAPSPGDLFFDIEGDPYAFDDGLDYLFGLLDTDETFTAIWSRDPANEFSLDGERRAFEQLVDVIIERLEQDPTMHVYHYAPYEPTALKRLMGRYGTREAEVDRLLREGVMVDLLRVVRQSLRASVESYSIKKMEAFYDFIREIDLRDAGSSIVAFEEWLQLGEGERPAATHLDRIERYNRDDVVSNLRLRDWLEKLASGIHPADRSRGPAAGRPDRRAAGRPDRGPGPGRGARRTSRRPRRRAHRPARADVPASKRPGFWDSSSGGIGARTSRCGGSSIGSWS